MTSINAQEVAKDVLDKVRKGQRPILGEIIKKRGYADSISKSPTKVTETDSYKEVIEENKNPVIEQLEEERQAILLRMKKTRNKAKYRDLTYSLDVVTKNHQLLTGGKTENNGIGELAEQLNSWINKAK